MAAPTITNVTLDKTVYAPGERPVVSFKVSDADTRDVTFELKVTDASGAVGTATGTMKVQDVLSIRVTDSEGGVWSPPALANGVYSSQRSAV